MHSDLERVRRASSSCWLGVEKEREEREDARNRQQRRNNMSSQRVGLVWQLARYLLVTPSDPRCKQ